MKLLLSTADLGGIDEVALPHVAQSVPPGLTVDFVRYDDSNFPRRHNALHPRLQAKLPKMLGHELRPGYDWYMWIDSSIYLTDPTSVIWMLSNLREAHIALFRHPYRSSISSELSYCKRLMAEDNAYLVTRYGNEPIEAQVRTYLDDPGFVDDCLFACGVFCYTARLVAEKPEFLSDWFYHCARHSVQDQLSLPYLVHKHSVRFALIDDDLFDTRYFGMKQHLR